MSDIGGGELLELLKLCKTVAITGHHNPDGDAIGACFSLALILDGMGVRPYVLADSIPEKYAFIPGNEFLFGDDTDSLHIDAFIAVDCGSLDRLDSGAELFKKTAVTINIDHHKSSTRFAKYNIVDENASSTCEMIYWLFEGYVPITARVGTPIFMGLIFDTGGFCHDSTGVKTHTAAGRLMAAGVDSGGIYRRTLLSRREAAARLMGVCMTNLIVLKNERIAYSIVRLCDLTRFAAIPADLDGLVEYMLNIDGIDTSILFSERNNHEIKVSFRTNTIDVSETAAALGGGGHKKAAGASVFGPLDDTVDIVIQMIKTAHHSVASE